VLINRSDYTPQGNQNVIAKIRLVEHLVSTGNNYLWIN